VRFVFALLVLLYGCGGSSNGNDGGADAADAADGGGGECDLSNIPEEPGGAPDCGFDPGITFDLLTGTVLQLESADGEICMRLERRDDSPFPDGSATLWTLLNVRVGKKGSVAAIDDPAALCWKVTHHNWLDAARVWTGTNRYDLELTTVGGHGGDSTYILTVFENGPLDPEDTYCLQGGSAPRCPPIELFPY
jgi:hypothetical protein